MQIRPLSAHSQECEDTFLISGFKTPICFLSYPGGHILALYAWAVIGRTSGKHEGYCLPWMNKPEWWDGLADWWHKNYPVVNALIQSQAEASGDNFSVITTPSSLTTKKNNNKKTVSQIQGCKYCLCLCIASSIELEYIGNSNRLFIPYFIQTTTFTY